MDSPAARRLTAVLAMMAAVALLLAPALWNGWPIVFFDTGGYIKRAFDLTLEPGRSLFYGLFLAGSSLGWLSLWGPVLLQAAATVWLVRLTLRACGVAHGALATLAVTALLALATGIGWYAAQLMPDALVPLLVLCVWLLAFHRRTLSGLETVGVAAVGLLALLSHMSSMALAGGLVICAAAAWGLSMRLPWLGSPGPLAPALLLAGAVVGMPLATGLITGTYAFTPGGASFIFGRLVQDGIAQRFLDETCPDPAYRLCAYKDRMPRTADDWIWHANSPFQMMGGFEGAETELAAIAAETLRRYPGMQITTAARSTLIQFATFKTGDGLDEWQEVTRWMISGYLAPLNEGFTAAKQQRQETTQALFDALNAVHVPVGWLSLALSLLALAWAVRERQGGIAALIVFVWLALLGNAFICGVLSNPHDRYQSRMIWLATLAVAVAAMRWWEGRRIADRV